MRPRDNSAAYPGDNPCEAWSIGVWPATGTAQDSLSSCIFKNEIFYCLTKIRTNPNDKCTKIPTNGKIFLILSEFAELKVLFYRNRFGKIFDFIGI